MNPSEEDSSGHPPLGQPPIEQQGALVRGCGYCQLLYPELSECARCSGGLQVEPAQMLDAAGIRGAVDQAVGEYDGTRVRLNSLLHVLVVYKPVSLAAFAEHAQFDLDRLRRDDRHLGS